ncbi:helix-turn-helix transcriptional regulator [Variovorax sp. VNK109]|uniref:helix-turn-helix transcriptional regulator n=1 Tax=Variovorax sp. VNK109 TaxID=3400919 RepID=UPI003C0163B0
MTRNAISRARVADALTDAIYDAALDPQQWPVVMSHLRTCFRSEAETFYVLDFDTRRLTRGHLSGIDPGWMDRFDELYFAPDNPWTAHSLALHRPGVVRTNERLDDYTRDPGVLYRSAYYNEWLYPQGLRHSLGNTLTTDRRGIANVTLLRARDLPSFSSGEVRQFEGLTGHFARALRLRERFGETSLRRDLLAESLDRLRGGMLIVDADGRLVHGNRAAMEVLARHDGLTYRDCRVEAALDHDRAAFAALLRGHAREGFDGQSRESLDLQRSDGRQPPMRVHAVGLRLPLASADSFRQCVMLVLDDTSGVQPSRTQVLQRRYGLTLAEVRLASCLMDGLTLRESAEQLGLTYGTARTRLKLVFGKTGTHRQAELVGQLTRLTDSPLRGH